MFSSNADVVVLHGESSSDAAYSTYSLGTAALPAAVPASAVSTECQSAGRPPSSRPGSDPTRACHNASEAWSAPVPASALSITASPLGSEIDAVHSTSLDSRGSSTSRATACGSRESAWSWVAGALASWARSRDLCSHGTAGSTDPHPHGTRFPPSVLGVAQRRSAGAPPPSSGHAIALAR